MYHNLYRIPGSEPVTSLDAKAAATDITKYVVDTSQAPQKQCHVYGLPNELILHILCHMSSRDILPLAPVSKRVHALTTRLLHARMLQATRCPDSLILECYPPSQKLTAPALDCIYTGTPHIDSCLDGPETPIGKLDALHSLYCRFKPQRREWRRFSINIPGDIPGSRTHPTSGAAARIRWEAEREQDKVKQILSLEGHELFVQLEGNLHLVRKLGFIHNLVAVHEGYVRIWRDWLKQRSEADASLEARKDSLIDLDEVGTSTAPDFRRDVRFDALDAPVQEHENVLWLDGSKNVGLKVNVTEKKWRRNVPILVYADEEVSVSYEITYEELFVRTSHLVLTLEKSAQHEDINTGKAVVFGSFR